MTIRPESTGADVSGTGTIPKLIPIVKMKQTLIDTQSLLSPQNNNSNEINETLLQKITSTIHHDIPTNEKEFKKIFDEYSDPVSYKQKYMDSNAFLIYYTKGFDGPNRDSIEKDIPRQTLQYGARNDVWNEFEELMVELKFADSSSSLNDIMMPLKQMIGSLNTYLSYAPKEDVEKAEFQLMKIEK